MTQSEKSKRGFDAVNASAVDEVFSDTHIKTLCKGEIKIVRYAELQGCATIEDLLEPYGKVCLLYEKEPGYGHWTTLLRVDDSTIEHFDSLGLAPDRELYFVSDEYRADPESGEDKPRLSELLKDWQNRGAQMGVEHKVIYNAQRLQKDNKSVSTCGRWAGLRAVLSQMPLRQFIDMFLKQSKSPDVCVTSWTLFVIPDDDE